MSVTTFSHISVGYTPPGITVTEDGRVLDQFGRPIVKRAMQPQPRKIMAPTTPRPGSLDVDALYDAGSLTDSPLAVIEGRRVKPARFDWLPWLAAVAVAAGGAVWWFTR